MFNKIKKFFGPSDEWLQYKAKVTPVYLEEFKTSSPVVRVLFLRWAYGNPMYTYNDRAQLREIDRELLGKGK